MADACVFSMEQGTSEGLYNVGTGEAVTIRELAETVMGAVGFQGNIKFDDSKPDGTPRRLLYLSRMHKLEWQAKTSLRDGIARAYADYLTKSGA